MTIPLRENSLGFVKTACESTGHGAPHWGDAAGFTQGNEVEVLQTCEFVCLVHVDPFTTSRIFWECEDGFVHSRLPYVDESHFTLESLCAVDSSDGDPVGVTGGEGVDDDCSRLGGYGKTKRVDLK